MQAHRLMSVESSSWKCNLLNKAIEEKLKGEKVYFHLDNKVYFDLDNIFKFYFMCALQWHFTL